MHTSNASPTVDHPAMATDASLCRVGQGRRWFGWCSSVAVQARRSIVTEKKVVSYMMEVCACARA